MKKVQKTVTSAISKKRWCRVSASQHPKPNHESQKPHVGLSNHRRTQQSKHESVQKLAIKARESAHLTHSRADDARLKHCRV